MTNRPYAHEGYCYFTTDDGKFYIDIAGDGTSATPAVIGTNRIVLSADKADELTAILQPDKGGTGQTSAKAAMNAFINALEIGSTVPIDQDYFISQSVDGGTTTTGYNRRPLSALKTYIMNYLPIFTAAEIDEICGNVLLDGSEEVW